MKNRISSGAAGGSLSAPADFVEAPLGVLAAFRERRLAERDGAARDAGDLRAALELLPDCVEDPIREALAKQMAEAEVIASFEDGELAELAAYAYVGRLRMDAAGLGWGTATTGELEALASLPATREEAAKTKVCAVCGAERPIADFPELGSKSPKDLAANPDGRARACRECIAEERRARAAGESAGVGEANAVTDAASKLKKRGRVSDDEGAEMSHLAAGELGVDEVAERMHRSAECVERSLAQRESKGADERNVDEPVFVGARGPFSTPLEKVLSGRALKLLQARGFKVLEDLHGLTEADLNVLGLGIGEAAVVAVAMQEAGFPLKEG